MLLVLLHPTAQKELNRIPTKDHERILDHLEAIEACNHPLEYHRVIKLSGRKTDDYRLRVGDWRVKFTRKGKNIFVTEIEHRQAGY